MSRLRRFLSRGKSFVRLSRGYRSVLIHGVAKDRFAALIDFTYHHYALGDTLTGLVKFGCEAEDRGATAVDLFVYVNPGLPRAPAQGFVTPDNYPSYLDSLYPAFLCQPHLGSFRLIRDPMTLSLTMASMHVSGAPHWPSLQQHAERRMSYPVGHHEINAFFARNGRLPLLAAPKGYEGWARRFRSEVLKDRFVVCINPRQAKLTAVPTTTHRDAPLAEWYAFIDRAARTMPDVVFLMMGGFQEWEHRLLARRNVMVPRLMGLGLAHELALMHVADAFMGTSSGFATKATFSDTPYLIVDIEAFFSTFIEVPVGGERYPFATDHQRLVWTKENADLLHDYLAEVYQARTGRRARTAARLAPAPAGGAGQAGGGAVIAQAAGGRR